MSDNQLTFHYGLDAKLRMGVVPPILTSLFGYMALQAAIHGDLLGIRLLAALVSALAWGLFLLTLRHSARVLAREPLIIVDAQGINDHRRPEPLMIPWDDVAEISFPRRWAYRAGPQHRLAIKFRDRRPYSSRIPLLQKPDVDYEIPFAGLTPVASTTMSTLSSSIPLAVTAMPPFPFFTCTLARSSHLRNVVPALSCSL